MSRAIKCDRCGKFEAVEANVEFVDDQGVKLMGIPNRDLCSSCALELTNWWTYPRLYSVKSVEPLTESIEEYVSDKNISGNDNLWKDLNYSPNIPMSLPDDTDEGLKVNTLEARMNKVKLMENQTLTELGTKIIFDEKSRTMPNKPGTDEKKPRSTTNVKWDDYMVDKLFNLLRDGKNHEQAADYLGTTVYSIQGILNKIRNAKSGDNYYPYHRKYAWYFEKRKYRQWDNESIVIVLEDIKRLGTVAAAARENNIPESSIYMVLNRVKASRNNPNHKYYPIYVQYADVLKSRVDSNTEPKSKDNVWTEERIKEALDLRTINGHSWNTVAEIMGLTQKDIHSLTQGIAGSNGRIHRIAKEYGYGE